MKILIQIMLFLGSLLMLSDVIIYIRFLMMGKDVVTGNDKVSRFWERVAFGLLVFFLMGYLGIMMSRRANLLTAGILLGGSIFVLIMLMLVFGLLRGSKQSSLEVSKLLVDMIESRDPYLSGHSRYVQNIVRLFYKTLPDNMKNQFSYVSLEYAALMHDIGNICVPESILTKNEKLSTEDWIVVRQHPRITVQLLERLSAFDEVRDWILYHHERVDGGGYYQLPAEQIPLPSQILALADSYAALTSRRAYRGARKHEEAMRQIREGIGTRYDEQLVEYFCRLSPEQLKDCRPKVLEIF